MTAATGDPLAYDAAAFQRDMNVSRETLEQLERYVALLTTWNRRINLVAKSTLPQIWWRHILDCAQLADLAPPGAARWIDIGSGAGLPGIVIALILAGRGPVEVDLVERNAKKCAFLREAVRLTDAPARVLCCDLDAAPPGTLHQSYDVITARAVASLDELLRLSAPLRKKHTISLFAKGEHVDSELTESRKNRKLDFEQRPSRTNQAASVIVIKETQGVR